MPIVLPPDPSLPLEQGDLLADIDTLRTPCGGPPRLERRKLVLVLSRPCNALRDDHVIVAPVGQGKYPDLKAATTPSDLLRAFALIRDGEGRPDGFYLGPLTPGDSSRSVALLHELYTISIPKAPEERTRFITAHRVHRLDPAFVRDLHLRVFQAFASLGFDDVGWWADDDLELVVRQCNGWVEAIDREIDDLSKQFAARQGVLVASGEPGKAEGQHQNALAVLQKRRRDLLAQFERERAEWARRRGGDSR